MSIAIKIENVSKLYRLGTVYTVTHNFNGNHKKSQGNSRLSQRKSDQLLRRALTPGQ